MAVLTLLNSSPGMSATYTTTDITAVSRSAVVLTKEVRNFTQNGTFGTNNQAKSGEVLEYRISYTNTGTSPVSNLVINDATPEYTSFVLAQTDATPISLSGCAKVTPANAPPLPPLDCDAPQAAGGTGALSWTFTGNLPGGAAGAVIYRALVD